MDMCKLVSTRNHPITISYDGLGMQLPPRGELVIENRKKLGALPKGVIVLPYK